MTAPAISGGPRTLPLMPASQQAALDPYMAQSSATARAA